MLLRLCYLCFKPEEPIKGSQEQNNPESNSTALVNLQKDVGKTLSIKEDNSMINNNPSNLSISSSFVSESISSSEKKPVTTPTPNNNTKLNLVRKLTDGFQRTKYKKTNGNK